MTSCSPPLMDIRDDSDGQPPIPAVCIIPEQPPPAATADAGEVRRADAYYDLLLTFARRFERAFLLHVRDGLVPLDWPEDHSETKYTDLKPHERHDLWLAVYHQLKKLLPAGHRVVCLLTGEQMRGFVKLGFPTTCPLAGMASPQRRYWVMDRIAESNFAVALAMFGTPAAQVGLHPPTPARSAAALK